MPDISLCQNETCAIHLNCYRFMALPSQHQQSYGEFDDDDCAEYLPLNLEQSRMVRMGRKAALAEEGTPGHRRMHPAFWELFRMKAGVK